jgi:hypothetical protein
MRFRSENHFVATFKRARGRTREEGASLEPHLLLDILDGGCGGWDCNKKRLNENYTIILGMSR